jgi:two-component system chemotaxis response regulator CheY
MAGDRTGRPRVVILEDQHEFFELLRDALSDSYQVVALTEHEAGSDRINGSDPDLVMIDLRLGLTDGWQRVVGLRADPLLAGIPLVICTADVYALREHDGELKALPNTFALTKPFDLDDLELLLGQAIGHGSTSQPAARAS